MFKYKLRRVLRSSHVREWFQIISLIFIAVAGYFLIGKYESSLNESNKNLEKTNENLFKLQIENLKRMENIFKNREKIHYYNTIIKFYEEFRPKFQISYSKFESRKEIIIFKFGIENISTNSTYITPIQFILKKFDQKQNKEIIKISQFKNIFPGILFPKQKMSGFVEVDKKIMNKGNYEYEIILVGKPDQSIINALNYIDDNISKMIIKNISAFTHTYSCSFAYPVKDFINCGSN